MIHLGKNKRSQKYSVILDKVYKEYLEKTDKFKEENGFDRSYLVQIVCYKDNLYLINNYVSNNFEKFIKISHKIEENLTSREVKEIARIFKETFTNEFNKRYNLEIKELKTKFNLITEKEFYKKELPKTAMGDLTRFYTKVSRDKFFGDSYKIYSINNNVVLSEEWTYTWYSTFLNSVVDTRDTDNNKGVELLSEVLNTSKKRNYIDRYLTIMEEDKVILLDNMAFSDKYIEKEPNQFKPLTIKKGEFSKINLEEFILNPYISSNLHTYLYNMYNDNRTRRIYLATRNEK